jgi:ubiquinone/menaquinone biosynthesis C-methylase UbiE
LKSLVKKILPKPAKTVLRRAYNSLVKSNEKAVQPQAEEPSEGELLPSVFLQNYVGGDYRKVGEEFFRYFVELAKLQPHESVLDVGSGSGRMAVPLTVYLSAEGAYEGFDISAEAVGWCRERITSGFPNFRFQVSDIYNAAYNPRGKYPAAEYRFPYEDRTFDFVFLTSVFTHLLPRDMEHYFSEIARVLKPGGRCLITYFLLNEESTPMIDGGRGILNFAERGELYRTINRSRPEDAVAYEEKFIRNLYEKYGLVVSQPIYYGSWCGREKFLSLQDMVLAYKA